MIAIVDYGLGNVKAFAHVYKKMNIPANIVNHAEDLKKASKVILPGVGAFDHAMRMLDKSGMRQVLDDIVLKNNIPVLGVCVGMQMLGRSSEEGKLPGLGWIDSEVVGFKSAPSDYPIRVPHMGWNSIKPTKTNNLLLGLEDGSRFYFLHSYFMRCAQNEDVIAVTDYGAEFACAINHGNIYGVQFHPEKSHQWGIRLLSNFGSL